MKVLTIKEPWAYLIIKGLKKYEFRSWKTNYRGDFLIHAGLGEDTEAIKRLKEFLPDELPKGKIIGKVTLTECKKCDDKFKEECLKENNKVYAKSSFEEKYAFKLENVEELKNPIEIKGKLGFWNYNMEE